MNLVIFK